MAIAPARSLYIDPIRPGELVDINFAVCYYVIGLPFNGAVCEDLPSNQYFNATVSWEYFVGEDEDNIPYLVSGNIESDTLNNVMNGFKFKAPEYMNIDSLQVKVTVSTTYNGSTIIAEDYITIEPDTSVIVKYNPKSIAPGDTTELIIQKVLYGGSIVNYSPLQSFEVGMINGCALGKLNKDEVDTNYLYGVTQPVYFIADSSADSGVVKVKVGLIIKDWEVTGKIVNSKNQNIQSKVENSVNEYCFIGNFKSVIFGEGDVTVEKSKLLIIVDKPPPYKNDVYISQEPSMPRVICKARLNNYSKGVVKFRWAYWVTNDFPRRNKDSEGNYYNLCHRISQSVFLGYSYANNEDTTKWTVPFVKDSGYYYFKAIWYKNSSQHPAYGCNDFTTEYEGVNEVFTGGEVSIKVTAYNSKGEEIDSDSIWVGKLLGQNQEDINTIYEYAHDNDVKAIIVHESATEQFETTNNYYPMYESGCPRYGYPNGYGLMQLDKPAAVEEQLWNWKSNIEGGKKLFAEKKKEALDDFKKWDVPINEPNWNMYFLINSFHKYNTGSSRYKYYSKSKTWGINPLLKDPKNNYGDKVYKKYLSLNP